MADNGKFYSGLGIEYAQKLSALCRKADITQPMMHYYLNGQFLPKHERLVKMAEALDVSPDWLLGIDEPENIQPAKSKLFLLEVLSSISCGCGIYNDGEVVDTIKLPEEMFNPHKQYFAVYAVGNSMTGAGIEEGDLLIFERTDVPQENKIGAFCIDNEQALCKRYKSGNGKIFLLSANDNYAPIVIDPLDDCFRTVGILVKVLKDYTNK